MTSDVSDAFRALIETTSYTVEAGQLVRVERPTTDTGDQTERHAAGSGDGGKGNSESERITPDSAGSWNAMIRKAAGRY